MRFSFLLTIALVLVACAEEPPPATTAPPSAARTAVADSVPDATGTRVTPPAPVAPDTSAVTNNTVSLSALTTYFGVDSLSSINFRPCNFTWPKPAGVGWPAGTYRARMVYDSVSGNSFDLTGDMLAAKEIYPNRYLILQEKQEYEYYLQATLVDSSLNVLWDTFGLHCDGPDGRVVKSFSFRNDSVYQLKALEYVGELGDTAEVNRSFTETVKIGRNGKLSSSITEQFFFPLNFSPDGPAATQDDRLGQYPLRPFSSGLVLPTNAIGVVSVLQKNQKGYTATVRFPGSLTPTAQEVLALHWKLGDDFANNYTLDANLLASPISITLFDTLGKTISIDTLTQLKLRFYCENDGPLITEPTFDFFLPATAYPGNLNPINPDKMGSIVAVAVANYQPALLQPALPRPEVWSEEQLVQTIYDAPGGNALASFRFSWDEAEDNHPCYGFYPINQLRGFDLSCCGP